VETVGVEPTSSSLQARRSPLSYVPERVRTDGVEPPQREAPRLQRGELTLAQRPHETRWPTGFEPAPTGLTTPGASVYTTATTKAGTTGLEPAASRLTSECSARLSYAPQPSWLLGRGAAPLGIFAVGNLLLQVPDLQ
jgi:hypothetical protein